MTSFLRAAVQPSYKMLLSLCGADILRVLQIWKKPSMLVEQRQRSRSFWKETEVTLLFSASLPFLLLWGMAIHYYQEVIKMSLSIKGRIMVLFLLQPG